MYIPNTGNNTQLALELTTLKSTLCSSSIHKDRHAVEIPYRLIQNPYTRWLGITTVSMNVCCLNMPTMSGEACIRHQDCKLRLAVDAIGEPRSPKQVDVSHDGCPIPSTCTTPKVILKS